MSNKQIKDEELRAKPQEEDFGHKYTEEGQGKIGARLLSNYFDNVERLLQESGIFNNRKNLHAIELGCGEGYSTEKLKDMLPGNVELMASEYVQDLVPKARKRNTGTKVIQESVYELKHKDSTFDVVFLLEVLEHLDYPDVALKEINRVLKKDGILVLGVPREPLWRALNMMRGKYLKDFGNTVGHLNHWSARGLQKYVEDNFGVVLSRKNPTPWTIVLAKKDVEHK
jgi:ubiquinone/menaquinone biosynthesis C-methylase UbiE